MRSLDRRSRVGTALVRGRRRSPGRTTGRASGPRGRSRQPPRHAWPVGRRAFPAWSATRCTGRSVCSRPI